MVEPNTHGDVRRFGPGCVPEPYRKEEVLAAARLSGNAPFRLAELVERTGLPPFIVHRVLSRLVKQRELVRWKLPISFPRYDKTMRARVPGGCSRLIYFYAFADAGE